MNHSIAINYSIDRHDVVVDRIRHPWTGESGLFETAFNKTRCLTWRRIWCSSCCLIRDDRIKRWWKQGNLWWNNVCCKRMNELEDPKLYTSCSKQDDWEKSSSQLLQATSWSRKWWQLCSSSCSIRLTVKQPEESMKRRRGWGCRREMFIVFSVSVSKTCSSRVWIKCVNAENNCSAVLDSKRQSLLSCGHDPLYRPERRVLSSCGTVSVDLSDMIAAFIARAMESSRHLSSRMPLIIPAEKLYVSTTGKRGDENR